MDQSVLFPEHLFCARSTGLRAAHVQDDRGNPEELTIRGGNPHGSFDQVPLAAREKQRMLFLGSQAGFPEEVAFTLGFKE